MRFDGRNVCAVFVLIVVLAISARCLDARNNLAGDGTFKEHNNIMRSGYSYDPITKTLTITGDGIMDNFVSWASTEWYSYHDEIEKVVIEDGITSIGTRAFQNLNNLKSIEIPQSVSSIGEDSFSGCVSLSSVTLPDNLRTISIHAFEGCEMLESPLIPSEVETIGQGAFAGCRKIESFNVDSGNTHIKCIDGVIMNYNGDKLIEFPPGREGDYTIPSNITSLQSYSFEKCSLRSLKIEANVDTIPRYFCGNSSKLETVIFSESIKTIDYNAFEGCTSLESITLPENIELIRDEAFGNCNSLTHVTFNGEPRCYDNSFSWSSLEMVCIPNEAQSYCQRNDFCKVSSCDILKRSRGKCSAYGCEKSLWMNTNDLNPGEFYDTSSGCLEYKCTKEKALILKSKCGEDDACIDGECVPIETTNEMWRIVLDMKEAITDDINIVDIKQMISDLCGIETNKLSLEIEYDDSGQILHLVFLLEDEKLVQVLSTKLEEERRSKTCAIGVLCRTGPVRIIRPIFPTNPSSESLDDCDHNTTISIFVLMVLLLFAMNTMN